MEGEREGESEGEGEDREARKEGERRESLTRYRNFATTNLSSLMLASSPGRFYFSL